MDIITRVLVLAGNKLRGNNMCNKTVIVDNVEYELVPVSTPLSRIIEASGKGKEYLDNYRIVGFDKAMVAVKQDGYDLQHVDVGSMSKGDYAKVCMVAVEQYSCALKYVDPSQL